MRMIAVASPGWKEVEGLGWGTWTTNYYMIARFLYKRYDHATIKKIRQFVKARVSELRDAVNLYEAHNRILDITSDDGFSDVLHHVVGLGEEEFKRVLIDITLLEQRYHAKYGSPNGYTESFSYCFHEPEYLTKQAHASKEKQEAN